MPTLAVARDYLFKLLGRSYSEEAFEKLCFEFGVELDDVTSERKMFEREQAKSLENATSDKNTAKTLEALSDKVIYKIDTPANRYDLLSAESMAIALKVFLGMTPPVMKVKNAASPVYRMIVDSSVRNVRDYIVCAVLKNIKFDNDSYNSFIDFQEKLHGGLARKRTLASVGTHDLDKIFSATKDYSSPMTFRYTCIPKDKISFVPLNQGDRVLNCARNGLEEYYKNDRNISKFVPLISGLDAYPTVLDKNDTILSLPPIINSDFSKIDVNTKNIFIECTATDHYKASVLVNQILCAFSSHHCENLFEVDAVEVVYPEGNAPTDQNCTTVITPDMTVKQILLDVPTANKRVGINISTDECAVILRKMYLYTTKVDDNTISVGIPAPRSDILHQCDLIEDVAIAYGYDNIVKTETPTFSYGRQAPINKLTHLLRLEVANAGYTEMLNFSLCSRDEAFGYLGRADKDIAVHIANPQTIEFQVCRPSLLPGALKTFNANKSQPLPIKLFEISDVVIQGSSKEYPMTGAVNRRHFCALHCEVDSSAFEYVHGLVEYVFVKLGVPTAAEAATNPSLIDHEMPFTYKILEGNDGAFFPGRSMDVILINNVNKTEIVIGNLGVIHPNTLKKYEISFPCSFCELDIQHFV